MFIDKWRPSTYHVRPHIDGRILCKLMLFFESYTIFIKVQLYRLYITFTHKRTCQELQYATELNGQNDILKSLVHFKLIIELNIKEGTHKEDKCALQSFCT